MCFNEKKKLLVNIKMSVENDLLFNNSWANIVESEINSSDDCCFKSDTTELIENKELELSSINFNKIESYNPEEMSIYLNLEIQLELLNLLKAKDDKEVIKDKKYLEWLKKSSFFLLKKAKLSTIKKRETDYKISRSSYKFCENMEKCKFNYDVSINSRCKYHHFVHNLVNADVINLIEHIENSKELNYQEIKKTISTTTFVVEHMLRELEKLREIYGPVYTSYHTLKSISKPKKFRKGKKYIKKL